MLNIDSLDFSPNRGDIIYTKRLLYKHYGIYIDDKHVVHFSPKSGFEISAKDALIRETSLADFLKDDLCFIEQVSGASFSPDETVKRARSLIGKQKGEYDLVFFNCEHFARWCKTGELKSKQVDIAIAGAIALTVGAGIALINKKLKELNFMTNLKNISVCI
jgi:hypothetical protein